MNYTDGEHEHDKYNNLAGLVVHVMLSQTL